MSGYRFVVTVHSRSIDGLLHRRPNILGMEVRWFEGRAETTIPGRTATACKRKTAVEIRIGHRVEVAVR
jgi:hypothetical protein